MTFGENFGRHVTGRVRMLASETSGAFGDLGTFLPYVVATLSAGLLAPTPVLVGFGVGYLTVSVVYRVPIAVQPMKALGAMIVTGGLAVCGKMV